MSGVSNVFGELQETVEKYSSQCINENNESINAPECANMLVYLQKRILPKIKNVKTFGWMVGPAIYHGFPTLISH